MMASRFSNNFGIQSLYVTRNVLQTTNIAEFRVSYQYSDLHVVRDVFEQATERPRRVNLLVAKAEPVSNAYNFHTSVLTRNNSSISARVHM
jgi:hypothetical protein